MFVKKKMDTGCRFEFRGAQLDLARQMETVEYVKSFVDFIARYDYNYLVLYLEGRIKTKSFPYRPDEESYSPDEMCQVVDYAIEKYVEVVPVVSLFGHAEHFVNCPELEHLAELRGGKQGRFSDFKHVFCPSRKETLEFLELYITEVSEIFPSEFFHVGFDEAWDIGYCDDCKGKLQSNIYRDHALACYDIVSRKLGKRMIMWDDLFDIYPDALDAIPRDVVMCSWHYDKLVDLPAGHCGGPGIDVAAFYEKLGFECIFAPVAFSQINIETFTRYASDKKFLGALMTVWEREREFLLHSYPNIACAGRLWNAKTTVDEVREYHKKMIEEIAGCKGNEVLTSLVSTLLDTRTKSLKPDAQNYLMGPLSESEHERSRLVDIARRMLDPYYALSENPGLGDYVMNDLAMNVENESVYFELRSIIPALHSPCDSDKEKLNNRLERCVVRVEKLKKSREALWGRCRSGLGPNRGTVHLDKIIAMLRKLVEKSEKTKALLNVKFESSGGLVDFLVTYDCGGTWEKISSGGFSAGEFVGPYRYQLPIFTDEIPDAVRVECYGYVGTGIMFLEFETADARYVPQSYSVVSGNVEHPEHLLENGRNWCSLGDGEQHARSKFRNPELVYERHILEVALRRVESGKGESENIQY